jgi:hypothetical protein
VRKNGGGGVVDLKRFGEYDGRLKGLLVRKDDGRERKWILEK